MCRSPQKRAGMVWTLRARYRAISCELAPPMQLPIPNHQSTMPVFTGLPMPLPRHALRTPMLSSSPTPNDSLIQERMDTSSVHSSDIRYANNIPRRSTLAPAGYTQAPISSRTLVNQCELNRNFHASPVGSTPILDEPSCCQHSLAFCLHSAF